MSDNSNNVANESMEVEETALAVPELESTKSLIDLANTTFKSLCETLEKEQQKLMELEQRRKVLQLEMEKLKVEIDEEKKVYSQHLEGTNVEGLEKSITDLNDDDPKKPKQSRDIENLDEGADASLFGSIDAEGSTISDITIDAIASLENCPESSIEKNTQKD